MLRIAIEYIRWLIEERQKINDVRLEDVEFYEHGMKVDVDPKVRSDWTNTGLSNTDFITSKEYRKRANGK